MGGFKPSLVHPHTAVVVEGLTGATAVSRYVGATASGAPVSGTFAVGDFVVAQDGSIFVCTAAGTPGTWASVAGSGSLPTGTTKGDLAVFDGTNWVRLGAGANDSVLTAASAEPTGLKWGAGGGGGSAAWQAYVPTWTSSGTAPSLGNGILTGRYVRHGATVTGWVEMQFGTTTTGGSGNWRFSAPLSVRDSDIIAAMNVGVAYIENFATQGYRGQTYYNSGTPDVFSVLVTGTARSSGDILATSSLITFGNQDYLHLGFTYETDAA